MAWPLQEAKRRFSEVLQKAIDEGPQVVTRHGEAVVVVVSAEEYRRLIGAKPDFTEFLLSSPDLGQLQLERERDLPSDVEL